MKLGGLHQNLWDVAHHPQKTVRLLPLLLPPKQVPKLPRFTLLHLHHQSLAVARFVSISFQVVNCVTSFHNHTQRHWRIVFWAGRNIHIPKWRKPFHLLNATSPFAHARTHTHSTTKPTDAFHKHKGSQVAFNSFSSACFRNSSCWESEIWSRDLLLITCVYCWLRVVVCMWFSWRNWVLRVLVCDCAHPLCINECSLCFLCALLGEMSRLFMYGLQAEYVST